MAKNVLEELSTAMADAVENAGKWTLKVNARARMPASGIAFAADLVLTADHVIEREEDISVHTSEMEQIPAKLAGRDPITDLGLLKLERAVLSPAQLAAEPAQIGQLVLAIARPTQSGLEASLGVVSAIGGPVRTSSGGVLERYIRTDSIAYPGFSGGPLVNAGGQIVGVNTSGLGRGAALTIPADLAWRLADTLARHGQIRRAYLGVRSQPVELPEASIQQLGRNQTTGLLLVGVEYSSPAGYAGLMVGDILVGIGDTPISDHDELYACLSSDLVGRNENITILRGGQLMKVNVKFKEN